MVNVKNRPEKDCPTCGKHFRCGRPDQVFCSRQCIRGGGKNHPVCPCGVQTDSYMKKYCCTEHRVLYGNKKTPVRMIEHICLGCGKTFTRPHYYPGKKKYCSNACSHKQVKKVRDKFIADLPEGAVVFHSGWEIRFWAVCLRVGVPIRSYDGPDIQTSAGIYRPDFMVGDDLVVEVKGWEDRPGTPERLAESGVIMVGKEHLARLERLFDRDMFLAALTGG
jgi:predicted nucleic acid-binding Zn ribbon protein